MKRNKQYARLLCDELKRKKIGITGIFEDKEGKYDEKIIKK